MKRATGLGLGLTLLLIVASMTPAAAGSGLASDSQQVGDLESDLVIIDANVTADGTATFEIQYAIRLADENETQAFEDLAADIEANQSVYIGRFADRLNATVDAAETATGRSMTVNNFDVSTTTATLGKEYGLITYSARWTNFANKTEDGLEIGDTLAGLFIDSDTRLQINWKEPHHLESVKPEPTDTAATQVAWDGPREFTGDQPTVILTSEPVTTASETTTGPAPSENEGPPWFVLAFAIVLIGLGSLWYHRRNDSPEATARESETKRPDESSSAAEEPSPPPELLSNEERVKEYLESVGGRAKQQEIVDALDWTEAKTSQVLSDMEAEDSIEKFRIGRENVVKLPEIEDQFE